MSKRIIWLGPTGFNPDLGYVVNNEPIMVKIPNEIEKKFKKSGFIRCTSKLRNKKTNLDLKKESQITEIKEEIQENGGTTERE